MAAPHSALEGLGFHHAGQWNTESGATVHHYIKSGLAGIGTPINHHVSVAEFPDGQQNAYYQVMHDDEEPFSDRDYDATFKNYGDGHDLVRTIGQHHQDVVNHIRQLPTPRLQAITPQNRNLLQREHPLVSYNSAPPEESFDEDEPAEDPHEALTGGDNPEFEYLGSDDGTHHYGVAYEDPEDPYMAYEFSVRHRPDAEPEPDDLAGHPILDQFGDDTGVNHLPVQTPRARQFSYNVTHYPLDMPDEHGEPPIGDFLDVHGPGYNGDVRDTTGYPVANFTNVRSLLDRHHNMMRSLGLLPKLPQSENENRGQFAKRADLARLIMERADEDLQQRRN